MNFTGVSNKENTEFQKIFNDDKTIMNLNYKIYEFTDSNCSNLNNYHSIQQKKKKLSLVDSIVLAKHNSEQI